MPAATRAHWRGARLSRRYAVVRAARSSRRSCTFSVAIVSSENPNGDRAKQQRAKHQPDPRGAVAYCTTKSTVFEVPPPGVGFITETCNVPRVVIKPYGTLKVSCVKLTELTAA